MRSVRTSKFKRLYNSLPPEVQARALKNFKLWKRNTAHPGLNFEKVDEEENIWSARVDSNHRAICVMTERNGETCYVWYWIGEHDEYLRLINS